MARRYTRMLKEILKKRVEKKKKKSGKASTPKKRTLATKLTTTAPAPAQTDEVMGFIAGGGVRKDYGGSSTGGVVKEGRNVVTLPTGGVSATAQEAKEEIAQGTEDAAAALDTTKKDISELSKTEKEALREGEEKAQGYLDDAKTDVEGQEELGREAISKLDPFIDAGVKSVGKWEEAMGMKGDPKKLGDLLASLPGFQFRMDTMEKATTRALSARGGSAFSGRFAKELQKGGGGIASSAFGEYLAQITGTMDMGAKSAGVAGQLGTQLSTAFGGAYERLGGAKAGLTTEFAGLRGGLTRGEMGAQVPLGTTLANIYSSGGMASANITTGAGEFAQLMDFKREALESSGDITSKDWLNFAGNVAGGATSVIAGKYL